MHIKMYLAVRMISDWVSDAHLRPRRPSFYPVFVIKKTWPSRKTNKNPSFYPVFLIKKTRPSRKTNENPSFYQVYFNKENMASQDQWTNFYPVYVDKDNLACAMIEHTWRNRKLLIIFQPFIIMPSVYLTGFKPALRPNMLPLYHLATKGHWDYM